MKFWYTKIKHPIREELLSPPWGVIIPSLLIVSQGFGYSLLYYIGVIFTGVFIFFASKGHLKYSWGVLLIIGIFHPPALHSTLIIAFLIYLSGYWQVGAGILASQLLYLLSPFCLVPSFLLSPYLSVVVFITTIIATHRCSGEKSKDLYTRTIFILYTCLLLLNLFIKFPFPAVNDSIGNVACEISLSNTLPPSNGVIVYNTDEQISIEKSTTYFFDHDVRNCPIIGGNYYQPRPWMWNQVIAGETIRSAIANDGYLIFNKGAFFNSNATHIIYSVMDRGKVIPMALNNRGRLILADSDMVTDKLAPYQKTLIRRLGRADFGYIIFMVLTCALVVLALWWKRGDHIILGIILFALLMASCLPHFETGNVRYVGSHVGWCHTNLGYGLARRANEQGLHFTLGNRHTTVLVIADGYSATAAKEKLIILEPGASVIIDSKKYEADSIPLGTADNIVDARNIFCEGRRLGPVANLPKGMVIIATGSPALLNIKNYIK